MAKKAERKSLETPEETRSFPKGKLELVTIGGISLGRGTFEPGWKWSECVKPIAEMTWSSSDWSSNIVSGRMKAVMDDVRSSLRRR